MARQVLAIEALTNTSAAYNDGRRHFRRHCAVTSFRSIANLGRLVVSATTRRAASSRRISRPQPFDAGVKVQVTGGMNRPPFEKSARIDVLFRHAQALARASGFDLKDTEMTGGAADATSPPRSAADARRLGIGPVTGRTTEWEPRADLVDRAGTADAGALGNAAVGRFHQASMTIIPMP